MNFLFSLIIFIKLAFDITIVSIDANFMLKLIKMVNQNYYFYYSSSLKNMLFTPFYILSFYLEEIC